MDDKKWLSPIYRVSEVEYTFHQAVQTHPKNTNAIIALHARCAAKTVVTSAFARENLKLPPNLILAPSTIKYVSNESHYFPGRMIN
jgi:hypothetical protein